MSRWLDRFCAVVVLGIAILSLRSAYLAFVAGAAAGGLVFDLPSLGRFALFGVGGLACVAGAAWLLSRRAPEAAGRDASQARLFGRGATIGRPARRLPLRAIVLAVPVVMAAALGADWFGVRSVLVQGPEGDIAGEAPPPAEAAPARPPEEIDVAAAPPAEPALEPPPAAAPPVEPPAAEPPAGVVPFFEPPAVLAEPPRIDAGEAGEPPAEPPQDIAAAPPVEPPETVAPLPPPVVVPTQPDGHRQSVVWLSLSPDGRSILSASTDHTIKLWDAAGMKFVRDLGAQKDMARTAIFLPDGASALTAGDDGEIVLRAVPDGAILHVFSAKDHGGVREVALSRDGRVAVSVHEAGTVIVWDIANRKVLHVLRGHSWSGSGAAISPDGSRAVSGSIDGELMLWDVAAGRELRRWQGHERGTYGAAFTPDGRYFVTGSGDMTIKLWDVATQQEVRRYLGHSGTVYAIAVSDDGKLILSAALDGTARLWDLATGKELAMFAGHVGPVFAVAFGPDGTVLTGGEDRTIRRWQADGAKEIALIPGAPE